MERKKIAVFASGWSPELIHKYIMGLQEGFINDKVDIYLFLNYAHTTSQGAHNNGELNIYNLPDLHEFSGAIIIGNGIDFEGLFEMLTRRCKEAGIPTVCTGHESQNGAYFVGSDNRSGAKELYEHIIHEHNCRNIVYFAGHKYNQDSNLRLETLRECLAEVGETLSDDNIIYTNWAPGIAQIKIEEWISSGKPIPDAFVCANDTLAMPVCDVLEMNGYSVPEDVIVVGFDNEFLCKIYDPAITSVDQCFDQIGIESAKILLDLMNGKERELETLVSSKFVASESCGCFSKFEADNERRSACKKVFHNNTKQSLFTAQLAMMENRLLEGSTVEDLGKNYARNLEDNMQSYEGQSFYLILEPKYEQSIYDSHVSFNKDRYNEVMKVAVSMDNGVITSGGAVCRRKLLPYISTEIKENRFFVFLPVHVGESNYGYIVFGDDVDKISDYNYLSSYVSRVSTTLQLYKQRLSMNYMNEKLIEYGTTDPLTHVKNRSAYTEVEERLTEILKNVPDYRFGIAMFDVNNLKTINDQLGHELGDKYIIGACNIINSLLKDSTLYRIGGDEFVTILKGDDLDAYEVILASLSQKIDELKARNIPVYQKYSVAAGVAIYDPTIDYSVADVLKRADEEMYRNKVAMKARR